MSVDRAVIQLDMAATLHDGAGVGEMPTTAARELGQDVVADALPNNRAHALVIGDKPRRIRRALRDAARLVTRDQILPN